MRILFLCVANSARSQMAEGLAKNIFGDEYKIESAGSKPTEINPYSIQALDEVGIDISSQTSKSLDSIETQQVDLVITLCSEEVCPIFPGSPKKIHWPLPDPAANQGSDSEKLNSFRQVRDEIQKRLVDLKKEFLKAKNN